MDNWSENLDRICATIQFQLYLKNCRKINVQPFHCSRNFGLHRDVVSTSTFDSRGMHNRCFHILPFSPVVQLSLDWIEHFVTKSLIPHNQSTSKFTISTSLPNWSDWAFCERKCQSAQSVHFIHSYRLCQLVEMKTTNLFFSFNLFTCAN